MEDPRVEAAAKALKTGKGWSYPFALKLATSALAAADAVGTPRERELEAENTRLRDLLIEGVECASMDWLKRASRALSVLEGGRSTDTTGGQE